MTSDYSGEFIPLDLFSTSPNLTCAIPPSVPLKCVNHAPYFAYRKTTDANPNVFGIVQGCCNSWSCPRCGEMRAKEEYGRMVMGCERLAAEGHELYFITITCRGKDGLGSEDATEQYLEWTNRLLDALRADAKKRGIPWVYAAVTERQKRGHPHSHYITTYYPADVMTGRKRTYTGRKQEPVYGPQLPEDEIEVLRSKYLQKRVKAAGLGEQYDISRVRDIKAAPRYVAKYLFKKEMFTADFPRGWRRIRYSQSFPKWDDRHGDAFILRAPGDWMKLSRLAETVVTKGWEAYRQASIELAGTGVNIVETS